MNRAFASTRTTFAAARPLLLSAIRRWRTARDSRQPGVPALFELFAEHRCGVLAPALDSVLRFYEACSGRRIRVGGRDGTGLSADERRVLDLLDGPEGVLSVRETHTSPGLVPAMRIALRSTRLMLRARFEAIGPVGRMRLPAI